MPVRRDLQGRHVIAKRLALARSIDYRLKPLLNRSATPIGEIRTADVEDFITDLRNTREEESAARRRPSTGRLIAAPHAQLGRRPRYLGPDAVPPGNGMSHSPRARRQHAAPAHRSRGGPAAGCRPSPLRAMIIAAIDTGMRRGEMLALRFADVDLEQGLITLRGKTTKSGRTRGADRHDPPAGSVGWLRIDADGETKPDEALVFSNEAGEPLGCSGPPGSYRPQGARHQPKWSADGYSRTAGRVN